MGLWEVYPLSDTESLLFYVYILGLHRKLNNILLTTHNFQSVKCKYILFWRCIQFVDFDRYIHLYNPVTIKNISINLSIPSTLLQSIPLPQASANIDHLCHCGLDLPILEVLVNEIKQYIPVCIWLISFICLFQVNPNRCMCRWFFFFNGWVIEYCIAIPQCVYSFTRS